MPMFLKIFHGKELLLLGINMFMNYKHSLPNETYEVREHCKNYPK